MKINAILMASGLSKRMGENKLFLKFKEKEIYKHTLDLLKELKDGGLLDKVVVATSYDEIMEEAEKRDFLAIFNDDNEIGKSASIKLGVEACDIDADMFFFVADQPLLTKESCIKIIDAFEKKKIMTFPVNRNRRGAPVLFPASFREKLLSLEGDQGGIIFAKDNDIEKVELNDSKELMDIDTIEQYEELINKHDSGYPEEDTEIRIEEMVKVKDKNQIWDLSKIDKSLVIVRGGGDVATGSIQKLSRVGFKVLVLESERPTCIRRLVSAAQAIYDGVVEIEDIKIVRCNTREEIEDAFKESYVAVTVDAEGRYIDELRPLAVVDGIIAKRNLGTNMNMAPITIGLGPGFTAGEDCNVVIETNRGHDLGRLIFKGQAAENTGDPGDIMGHTTDRILRASDRGKIKVLKDITSIVEKYEIVAEVNGKPIFSRLDGMVRGMINHGSEVFKGMKVGDVDPRPIVRNAYTISDKARLIGGGTLEAILILKRRMGI